MNIRVGFGYDVHRLEENRILTIGGIQIPHYKGEVAHSDGDALIHAICDALLGAAGLRDIGFHFPDTSNEFKDIDSKILLRKTVDMLHSRNISIINTDCTICLEKPKLKDFIPKMQSTLASLMNISLDRVSIKATTNEKMGFIGNEDGISAYSVVLIMINSKAY